MKYTSPLPLSGAKCFTSAASASRVTSLWFTRSSFNVITLSIWVISLVNFIVFYYCRNDSHAYHPDILQLNPVDGNRKLHIEPNSTEAKYVKPENVSYCQLSNFDISADHFSSLSTFAQQKLSFTLASLHRFLSQGKASQPIVIDIGGNKGLFTGTLMQTFCDTVHRTYVQADGRMLYGENNAWKQEFGKDFNEKCALIYSFESHPGTFEVLKDAFQIHHYPPNNFHPINLGLSDFDGTSIVSGRAGVETNGLDYKHPNKGSLKNVEKINVSRFDTWYKKTLDKRKILFAKIDTEGFDPLIIRGMDYVLSQGLVHAILFEYNTVWRTRNSGTLKGTVEYLHSHGYISFLMDEHFAVPITGKYWMDKFEDYGWKDVLALNTRFNTSIPTLFLNSWNSFQSSSCVLKS